VNGASSGGQGSGDVLARLPKAAPIANMQPRMHQKPARQRIIRSEGKQSLYIAARFLVACETRKSTGAIVQRSGIAWSQPQRLSENRERLFVVVQPRERAAPPLPGGCIVPSDRQRAIGIVDGS